MIKRFIFLLTALSIVFCSSIVSLALATPNSRDDITGFKIKLSDAPKNVYDFFYEWHNTPNNKRFLVSSGNNDLLPNGSTSIANRKLSFSFGILETVSTIEIRLQEQNNTNGMRSRPPCRILGVGNISPPYSSDMLAVSPLLEIRTHNPWNSDFSVSFETYYSLVSAPFTTIYSTEHDWNKNTATTITYDVDISKTYEEYQASKPPDPPPSSSSETPTPPPVIDPPVVVPPEYDDTYVPYNPNVWQGFFDSISKDIGSAVNIGLRAFALIFGIFIIIKIVKHYVGK